MKKYLLLFFLLASFLGFNGNLLFAQNALNFYGSGSAGDATGFSQQDFVSIPDNGTLDLNQAFTIEAWIKVSDAGNNTIIDKGNYQYAFQTHTLGTTGLAFTRSSAGWVYSGGNIPLNTWTHVAVTYDYTSSTVYFYINGTAYGPFTYNILPILDNGPITIGKQNPSNCACNFFDGSMDELRIWNRALTQCEITTNMNCETPLSTSGLLAMYHFNQGVAGGTNTSISTLIDASGNGNTGTLTNFARTGTTGNFIAASNANLTNCTATSTPTITTHPSATAVSYCLNATASPLTVSATGTGLTYSWVKNTINSNTGGTLAGSTTTSYTPLTTTAGTSYYYCIVKNAGGCTVKSNVSGAVTINTLPTITGQTTVPVGFTTTLVGSASADATSPWTSSDNTKATVSNAGVVTGIAPGSITITYKNSNGCVKTFAMTVVSSGVYYSQASGNVLAPASWATASGTLPTLANLTDGNNEFVIQAGHKMTANAGTFKPLNLTIENTGGLAMGTNTLNFPSASSILTLGGVFETSGTISSSTIKIEDLEGSGELRFGSTTWAGISNATGSFFDTLTNKVTFFGTTALSIPNRSSGYPTLQIEGTGIKSLVVNTLVNKDLIIKGGASLNGGASTTLTIKGNFQNSGTFIANTSTVVFAGTEVQNISGSTSFYNLSVNNIGKYVTLGVSSPISIANALALTNGRLQIGDNNLTYNSSSAKITGAGWVETNGTGVFSTSTTGTFTFPVGDANNAQAITLNTIPTGTTTTIRFGAPSDLPIVSTGSWYFKNTVSNYSLGSGFVLKNPIGNHNTASKIAYKLETNIWIPLVTTNTGNDFTTTNSVAVYPLGEREMALYTCSTPDMSGPATLDVGETVTFTGSGTPHTSPWTSSNTSVATISNTGVVTAKASGTTTITYMDYWGCTNSMALTVAPPTKPLGNRGMYFDGINDYVTCPIPTSASTNITLEAWVKINRAPAGNTYVVYNGQTSFNGYGILVDKTLKFGYLCGARATGMTSYSLQLNKWTHLAIVREAGVWRAYADGVLQTLNNTGVVPITPAVSCKIGGNDSNVSESFPGQIDEVRVFTQALTQAQILADMGDQTNTATGLAAYWNFEDDASGVNATVVKDIKSGTNGTRVGGPLWALRVTDETDNSGAGLGSLRQAITEANKDSDQDYIDFSIQQDGSTSVIQPTSGISITQSVFFDGYSAFGSKLNTAAFRSVNNSELRLELDASLANAGKGPGQVISLNASNSILTGFAVHSGGGVGLTTCPVAIAGTSNTVRGCYSGLKADGSIGGMNAEGWRFSGTGHIIGRSTTSDFGGANIFSNTDRYSLRINASNCTISGNYFGTDKTGNTAIYNHYNSIFIESGTSNTINRNLLTGNRYESDLRIDYGPNTVTGNLIGLNADSTKDLTDTDYGISFTHNTGEINIIGGDAAGQSNTIAYHTLGGIDLSSEETPLSNQIIRQNKIYCNGNTATGIVNSPVTKPTLSGSFAGTTLNLSIGNLDATGTKDIYLYKNTLCGSNQGEKFVAKATTASGVNTFTYSSTAFVAGDKVTAMYVSSSGSSVFSDVLALCDNPLTVTSTADDSTCGTLRYAIGYANRYEGLDVINFNISGTAPFVIAPLKPLPDIKDALTIDGRVASMGYTDPTSATKADYNLVIEIDGSVNGFSGINGLNIKASDVTIRGLSIVGFADAAAIYAEAANNVAIEGNYLGLRANGDKQPNGNGVIFRQVGNAASKFSYIGGGSTKDRNVICANNGDGIQIINSPGIAIIRNFVGVWKDGTLSVPNNGSGVYVESSDKVNIGINQSGGFGNVIASNKGGQITVNTTTTGVSIVDNYIGLASNGTTAIASPGNGITINDSKNTIIGSVAFPNKIANNSIYGIFFSGSSSQYNSVISNSIYANTIEGIGLEGMGEQEIIQAPIITTGVLNGDASATFTLQAPSGTPSIDSVSFYADNGTQGQVFLTKVKKTSNNVYSIAKADMEKANVLSGTVYYTAIQTSTSLSSSSFSNAVNLVAYTPPTQPLGNRGMYFDGLGDHVTATLPTTANNNITLEAWVKIKASTNNGAIVVYNGNTSINGYGIYLDNALNFKYLCGGNAIGSTPYKLTPNRWTHLAIVRESGVWKAYVNGVQQTLDNPNIAPKSIPTDNFKIGGNDLLPSESINGQIDEVKVFNTARTSSQILADMGSVSVDGALGYWDFENDSDVGNQTTALNVATNLKDATIAGALWALRTTNTLDDGSQGSLRWVLKEANSDTDKDYIDFSIQQDGTVSVIQPTTTIDVTEPVILDGYSAFGSKENTASYLSTNNAVLKVEMDMQLNVTGAVGNNGITLNTSNSTIKGLSVYNTKFNSGTVSAIRILSGGLNAIEGNWIGFKANGTPTPNMNGIIFANTASGGNTIGWSTIDIPGKYNLLSNFTYHAIIIYSGTSTANTIKGNYIGTDATGKVKAGVMSAGVVLQTTDNILQNNIIAFGTNRGVFQENNTKNFLYNNLIFCNSIGVDVAPALITKPAILGSIEGNTSTLTVDSMDATGSKVIYFYKNTSCGKNQGETFVRVDSLVANGVSSFTFTGTSFALGDVVTVRYVSSNGSSVFSNPLTLTRPAPKATAATLVNKTGFRANWSNTGASSYELDISTSPTFATLLSGYPKTGITDTFYLVTGLTTNTVYYYRVRNVGDVNNSNSKMTSTILPPGSGNGLKFDGINNYITVPHNPSLDFGTGDFSMEAWVKRDKSNVRMDVISKNQVTANSLLDSYYQLVIEGDNKVRIYTSNGGSDEVTAGTTIIPTNQWVHLAAVRSGSATRIYVNGVLDGTGASTQNVNSTDNLHFGTTFSSTSIPQSLISGSLDEVKLWNKALTQAEIQNQMCQKLTGSETGLVCYFRMDENAGTITENRAKGSTIDGTFFGTPTWVYSGAPVGDVSKPEYNTGITSVSFSNTDKLTINNFTLASSQGIQVYKVNEAPSQTGLGTGLDSLHLKSYFGVFPIGVTGYKVTYDYSTTNINGKPQEGSLTLANRQDNSIANWDKITNTTLDMTNNAVATSSTPLLSGQKEIIGAFAPPPLPGAALDFDGVNDNLSSADVVDFANNSFTIELWVKRASNTTDDFIMSSGSVAPNQAFIVGFVASDNSVRMSYIGSNQVIYTGSAVTELNKWHHWAFRYNSAAKEQSIYLDGVKVASYTTDSDLLSSNVLSIGKIGWDESTYFHGQLDEIRVWNRALCESEIQNNMYCDNLASKAGLQVQYSFNQGIASANNATVTIAADSSGNNNNATLGEGFSLNSTTSNWVIPGAVKSDSVCKPMVLSVGTNWTWTGSESTDWFSPCNWDRQSIPLATSSVVIPGAPVNQPIIAGAGNVAKCKNITINTTTGAKLIVNKTSGASLEISQ